MDINGYSVSIVIPVYNVENYIEECLRSIMSQSYTNFECILVDDCGKDKSIEIAKSIISEYKGEAEFKIIGKGVNSGVSASRNYGIREAKGDFLLFVDSDDRLLPESLNKFIEKVKVHPGVDIVQGNSEIEDPKDMRASVSRYKVGTHPEFLNDASLIPKTMLHWTFPITAWNKFLRRSFIIDNNLFFKEGIVHEDLLWVWMTHKYVKSISFIDEDTYWYRTKNANSIMGTSDCTKSFVSRIKVYEYIALNGTTQNDVCFNVHSLYYTEKFLYWDRISDKKQVKEQLKKTIETLKSKGVDYRYIQNLKLLQLPIWVMKNPIFSKLYYEYTKRNNLEYSFS